MRIMLTDRSETSARVGAGLRAEGHDVLEQCLPGTDGHHACQGLADHDCPLDVGVDLALTAVAHEHQVASAGVVCAHRAGVPVVAVGRHDAGHPDLVRALEHVAELGDTEVTASVRRALQAVLTDLGITGGDVALHRDATVERIVAVVPGPIDEPTRSRIAVRLLDAATSTGRHGARRDVVVQTRA
jgi:hypothetical protein